MDQNKKPIVFDLLSSLRCHVVQKHDVVFYTGERSAKFYLIIQGQVKVLMNEAKTELTECPIPGLYEKQMSDKKLFPNRENRWEFKIVATLSDGQTFGELGILHDKPRLATVIATEETVFGVINSDDFKRILEPTMVAESEEKLRLLKPLLEYQCSYEEYWRLAAYFTKKPLVKYTTLYEEGEPFTKVYFITSGMVRMEKMVRYSEYQEAEGDSQQSEGLVGFPSVASRTLKALKPPTVMPLSTKLSKTDLACEKRDHLRRPVELKTNWQPLVIFGQNQFLGFKEIMENIPRYCMSARVVETGVAFAIEVENMKRCFSEFGSFKRAFYALSSKILDQLNVN